MLSGRRDQQPEERRQLRGYHRHLQLTRLGLLLALALAGCRREAADTDVGDLCLDVAGARACWGSASASSTCAGSTCLVPPAHAASLRCTGRGGTLRCVERARAASGFVCDAGRCVQHHPRMPDDGEWECSDLAGAVVCRGGIAPAGVSAGAPDVGWVCGERADGGAFGRAICVDLAPDLPSPRDGAGPWECSYSYLTLRAERICLPRKAQGFVGDACASESCLRGARCVSGRCLPPRPRPSCWLDAECSDGHCNFGSCAEAP